MPSQAAVVEWFSLPESDPAVVLATQWHLLDEIAAGRRPPALLTFSLRDDHAALGRFHLAPSNGGDGLCRRFAGGRVLPLGPGYAGLTLLLPRADAHTGDSPGSLSASQIMNRHVRGFLKGCRHVGVDPIYPGRDVVTIDKKIVAALGLEVDGRGAAVFEMVAALWRAFDEVAPLLDRVDPEGTVTAAILGPQEVTDLEREVDPSVDFDVFAQMMRHGYGEQLRATLIEGRLSAADVEQVNHLASDGAAVDRWVRGRRLTPRLDRRGTALGSAVPLDVFFEENDGVLGEVLISGDFIANSGSVTRLEAALRGCRRDAAAIDAAIAAACSQPGDYLLGVSPLTLLRDAIVGGEPW